MKTHCFTVRATENHTCVTDVCVYKTKQYYQGQRWRDGCDYQCTCQDAATGRYQCEDL